MGRFFLNTELNSNNVLEVDFNLEKLKELEIIKSSFLWGTNKNVFSPSEFTSKKLLRRDTTSEIKVCEKVQVEF